MNKGKLIGRLGSLFIAILLFIGMLYNSDILTKACQTPQKDTITINKTAEVENYDERTYQIHLSASSNKTAETQAEPISVVLAIDKSTSMKYPSKLEVVAENITLTNNNLNQYRRERFLYVISDRTNMATMYRFTHREDGWYFIEAFKSDNEATKVGDAPLKFADVDNEGYTLYKAASGTTRFTELKKASTNFLKKLKTKSEQSKFGIVTFADTSNKMTGDILKDTNTIEEYNGRIWGLETESWTNQTEALNSAAEILKKDNSTRKKYIVLVTDGAPTTTTAGEVQKAAENLRNSNVTLITLGLSLGENEAAKQLMNDIASIQNDGKNLAYEAEDGEQLTTHFETIFQNMIKDIPITDATINDNIDSRFEIIDETTRKAVTDGTQINGGTVHVDEAGDYSITWTNQTINAKGEQEDWNQTICIRAKSDFMGGNTILTNKDNSCLTVGGMKLDFPKPSVNVKLLPITQVQKEKTVLKGDWLEPQELFVELKNELGETFGKENRLSDDELKQLLKNSSKKIYKSYSYKNTNDEVGKFEYRIEKISSSSNFKNHQVTKQEGKNKEQYRLVVSYIPNTNRCSANSIKPGTFVRDSIKANNDYNVHVISIRLNIKKISEDVTATSKELEGAEFKLQRKNAEGKFITLKNGKRDLVVTTDENGYTQIPDISVGEYCLKETKAPSGYQKLKSDVYFEVNTVKNLPIEGKNVDENYIDGINVINAQNLFVISKHPDMNKVFSYEITATINNDKLYELPETGGAGTKLYTISGAVIITASLLLFFTIRRKKRGGIK